MISFASIGLLALFSLLAGATPSHAGFFDQCGLLLEAFHPARYSSDPMIRYSGKVSIPAGKVIQTVSKDGKHITLQSTHHVSELDSRIQAVVSDVKRLSVEGAPLGFRAYVAQIAVYKDGSLSTEMRTSNESDRVAAEVMTAYQNDPVFLDDLRAGKIEKIISIHSRAGHEFVEIQGLTEDMKLLISRQDFHSYGISQAFFHAVSPSPIEFVGIVVPVSKKTPDLYFQADSFPANLEALKVYRNQEHILELEKQHNELFAFIHKMEREHKETVDEQHAYQEKTNKENFAHVDKIQKAYKEVIDELIVDRNKAVELSNKAVELSEKLHRVYADALEAMGKKKPDPIQN